MDFTQTTLFTGSMNIVQGLVRAFIAGSGIMTVFFAVKNAIAWQAADDQEKPAKKKRLITDILIGILTITITGIVVLILGAFGVDINIF